ncbi:MAG: DUF4058 family protein [Planctomycetaceae bacterium]
MRSPFPGMDPYLELFWRDVRTSLTVYSRDQVQAQLPRDLLARVEEGVSIDLGGPAEDGRSSLRRTVAPDVSVVEESAAPEEETAGGVATAVAIDTTAIATPMVVPTHDDFLDRHVEIIDASSGNRVVTVIEFLSPSNKLSGPRHEEYVQKQQEYLAAGVNLVEVDLIRQGMFTLAVPAESIPGSGLTIYQICVRRANRPREAEVYPVSLRERLPTFRIPLRPADRDVYLDVQALIDQCYERGRYDRIDYSIDPMPPLPAGDGQWIDELLRAAGRRQ